MLRRLRVAEIVLLAELLCIVMVSIAWAKADARGGDAADFVATFPWVAVGLFGTMVLVVGFFLVRTMRQYDSNIQATNNRLEQTNISINEAISKIDTTINLLFDRDREAERGLAATRSAIAAMEATCRTQREMCGEWKRGINCLDRRKESDDDRRTDNGRREHNGNSDKPKI